MKRATTKFMAIAAIAATAITAGATGSGSPGAVDTAHAASSSPTNGGRAEGQRFRAVVYIHARYRYDARYPRNGGPTDNFHVSASNKLTAFSQPFDAQASFDRRGRMTSGTILNAPELNGNLTSYRMRASTVTHQKIKKDHGHVEWRTCTSGNSEELVGSPPLTLSLTGDLLHRRFRVRPPTGFSPQVGHAHEAHCGDVSERSSGLGSPSYLTLELRHPDDVTCITGGSFAHGYESGCTYETVRRTRHGKRRLTLKVNVLIEPA